MEEPVISTPKIETATLADAVELAALRTQQGWGGAESLLRATLTWEGCRTFVLRAPEGTGLPGTLIGSTLALAAPPVGIIGNVIVDAGYQRQGLGRRLMEAALGWQRAAGVRTVLLDATVNGRPLYTRLGFRSMEANSWVATLRLSTLTGNPVRTQVASIHVRRMGASALPRLAGLDTAAFGGDRQGLLARVLDEGEGWLYVAEGGTEEPVGYLLARSVTGAHASLRPGPFVARQPEVAAALLRALSAEPASRSPWRATLGEDPLLNMSLPGTSPDALRFFAQIGARLDRDDLLMRLDLAEDGRASAPLPAPRPIAAHPEWIYAWLAPMVF
jgi:ribosomal protein S18 acetylase RimI-like enzyme